MKRASGPYRDKDFVLKCQHGRRLHIACKQCQEELERQEDAQMAAEALLMMLTVVAAIAIGLVVLFYFDFFN